MPASENPPLTSAEQVFLQALNDEGVPFLVVGLGAAVLQGADTATQDLDLWFGPSSGAGIRAAALRAGGFYAERTEPPMVGGPQGVPHPG